MEHRNEVINTGNNFEQLIYKIVEEKCKKNCSFIVHLHKKYFSVERQDYIIPDITIEKIVDGEIFFIIVIECKDYAGSISVSEVEEFHAKLQQIGADNTKGVMVTCNGKYQKSAHKYAKSKGISLTIYDRCSNGFRAGMHIASMFELRRKKIFIYKIIGIIKSTLYLVMGILLFLVICITMPITYCIQLYKKRNDFEKIINDILDN